MPVGAVAAGALIAPLLSSALGLTGALVSVGAVVVGYALLIQRHEQPARTGRTVARLRQRLTASHRPGPAPGRAGLRWAQIRIVPSARMVQPGLCATSQT